MIRRILRAAFLLGSLSIAACKRESAALTSPDTQKAGPTATPALSQPVAYDKLEWKDESFYLNGQPFNGVTQNRHANGQISAEYPMKDGKPHGLVREWYDNGQLSTETNFENGERHGGNRYWSKEGRLMKEQVYDHGHSVSEKVYPTQPAAEPKK